MKLPFALSAGRALLLTLPFLTMDVSAVTYSETLTTGYTIMSSGTGWRLLKMPTSNFLSADYVAPAAALPLDPQVGEGYTAVYIIDSATGLNNSPLPAAIKNSLAAEFATDAALRLRKKNTPQRSLSDTDPVEPMPSPIVVHKGMAEAIAAGTASTLYAAFKDASLIPGGGVCSDRWFSNSVSGSALLNGNAPSINSGFGGPFTGTLQATLPASGTINYRFGYQYMANTCEGIPWALKMDAVRTSGSINLNNTSFSLDGTVNSAYHWESPPSILHRSNRQIWVGAIPAIFGIDVPVQFGIASRTAVAGHLSVSATANGTYSFTHDCSAGSCRTATTAAPSFSGTGASRSSGSNLINATPFAKLETNGILYDSPVIVAGVGSQFSAPSTYWGYQGNACGDANGDGVPEPVKSTVVDANAQIAAYSKFKVGSSNTWGWINQNSSVGGFQSVRVSDYLTQGKPAFNALRRNLFFREYENLTGSALTPIIAGPNNAAAGPVTYTASMRPCYPFTDRINYVMGWNDGTPSSAFSGLPNQATAVSHTYTTPGARTLKLTVISDVTGRNFGSPSTTRLISITGSISIPTPPTLDVVTLDLCTGENVARWNASNGATRYDILLNSVNNPGTASNFGSSSGTEETITVGRNSYVWVKACNAAGCSAPSNTDIAYVNLRACTP